MAATKADLLLKKGQLANEAGKILEEARADGRETINKEEEAKFNKIHADIDEITKTVNMLNRQEEVERTVNDTGTRRSEPDRIVTSTDTRLSRGARDNHDAMRAWFLSGARSGGVDIPDYMLQAAKRVGLDINNRSMNIRLGPRPMRASNEEGIRQWQRFCDEERAMAGPQNSTSAGGYSIQDAAMRELEIALLAFGGMRANSTILRTDTGGPLPYPTVNDTTNVGSLIGENTTVGTQDLALSQLVLDAYKYTSKAVLISVELMQDNSINLGQILGGILGERLGRITNTHFTTGTGTGQPNGVVTAATFTQATTGNTTAITYANLIALYHSVDPAYRDRAKFMMNDNSISKLKLMTDSQGRPLWLPGLVDRAPDTILGAPYVINQDMSSMTISGKSILFGDFSKYLIRDTRDVTLLRLDERYAEFLQVAFVAFLRTDGDLLNAGTNPIKGYQNST